jgi:hypothetical protein
VRELLNDGVAVLVAVGLGTVPSTQLAHADEVIE